MMRSIVTLALAATVSSAYAQEIKDSGLDFTLNAGEEPEQKPWTQPATFSYTSSDGAKDSWSVDLAAKLEGHVSGLSNKLFVRALVKRNTLEKKKSEQYGLDLGYSFDFDTANNGPNTDQPDLSAWYFFGDLTMGYRDKKIYPDASADCTGPLLLPACFGQNETSLLTTAKLMPFRSNWETTFFVDPASGQVDGPSWTYSFAPVVTVFDDQIIDAQPDAGGRKPKGDVLGAKLEINAAFSPRFTGYRLVLRYSYQTIHAFNRDTSRRSKFKRASELYKLSADFELGQRSFRSGVSGWVPMLGITYTHGDDPLSGRLSQNNLVATFNVTYRTE